MPIQPNNTQQINPNLTSVPTTIGTGTNNMGWTNPWYPQSVPPIQPAQQPNVNQFPSNNYAYFQQPTVPVEQTTQTTEENGPTLTDVMNAIQDLDNRIDGIEALIKKPRNNNRQNGSKYYKKESNNA